MSDSIDDFFKKKKATKKKKTVVSLDSLNRKIKETNMRQQQEDAEAAEAEDRALNENGRVNPENLGVENDDPDWLTPTNDAIDSIEIETKGIRLVTDSSFPIQQEEEVVEQPEYDDEENNLIEKEKPGRPGWNLPNQDDVVPIEPEPLKEEKRTTTGETAYVPGAFKGVGKVNVNKPQINDVEQFPTLGGASEIEDEQKRQEQELAEKRKQAAEKTKSVMPNSCGKKVDLMKEDLTTEPTKYHPPLGNRSANAYVPPGGGGARSNFYQPSSNRFPSSNVAPPAQTPPTQPAKTTGEKYVPPWQLRKH